MKFFRARFLILIRIKKHSSAHSPLGECVGPGSLGWEEWFSGNTGSLAGGEGYKKEEKFFA